MSLLALALGLAAFVLVLRLLQAKQVATRIIATSQAAMLVIADPALPEREKEVRVRRASLDLFRHFLAITAIGAISVGSTVLIVWGGAQLGLYGLSEAVALGLGWPFLIGSTLAAVLLWLGLDRAGIAGGKAAAERADGGSAKATEEVPYSPLDKALHVYAFASPARQKRLGEIENRLFRQRIARTGADRPVFVTSLPRAGTTIMLNMLADVPEFASATYRHMPFTLSPLLWGRFSAAFRKAGKATERAHGDGLTVSVDSPEAFEEMLWMAFWPDHYRRDRILPWTAEARAPEFEAFLRAHMAKIVSAKPGAGRYVSKNNANIARLGLIEAICPDAAIVIPVRDPIAQVASLLRQHARFSDLHGREPFARQYMEGVGHFEFGEALRPIAFAGAPRDLAAARTPDFWLHYWTAAYETVLAEAGAAAILVDHDALCADPGAHLPALAEAIRSDAPGAIVDSAGLFRASAPPPDLPGADPRLVARAREIHAALCGDSRALRPITQPRSALA